MSAAKSRSQTPVSTPVKPSQLMSILSMALRAAAPDLPGGFTYLTKGSPGTGKTSIYEQAAAACGAKFMVRHPVVDSPIDYKGIGAIINEDGSVKAEFLPFGDLRAMVEATTLTMVLLDDLGQAPPAVQAAAMQLLLARRINGHALSPWVVLGAATNKKEDKAGVQGILEPVKSRFDSILELVPDMDDWCKWALAQPWMPTECIAFIRYRPNFLLDFQPTTDMVNSPSPRTVTKAFRQYAHGMPRGCEYPLIEGAAGAGFAGEFLGFIKIYESLPNPDVVLMNPGAYKVPTDPATLYALSGALAARANEENADRFFKAIGRLPEEFSILSVRDALARNEKLANLREFVQWVVKHQDVLL